MLLQALGHYVLGHQTPTELRRLPDAARGHQLLRRRAAAARAGHRGVPAEGQAAKEIAVEDIRDAFAVSYETAAHRFTNLATQHLGIRTHFQKTHKSGIIYKAYENDGVTFPQDHTGAIEGQPSCRNWTSRAVFDVPDKFSAYNQYTDTPAGTYWCTARTERSANGEFSLSVGRAVPAGEVVPRPGHHGAVQVHLPGRKLLHAARRRRWPPNGPATPGPRPAPTRTCWPRCRPGAFPGVDETEVY